MLCDSHCECREQFFVLRLLDRVRQILAQELGRAARDLDCELDVWLWQDVGKIRFGCDQNVRRLASIAMMLRNRSSSGENLRDM